MCNIEQNYVLKYKKAVYQNKKEILIYCLFNSVTQQLINRSPKRRKRQFCKLEALLPEWDADDRHTKQKSVQYRAGRQRYAADYQPDDICDSGYGTAAVADVLPKGTEGQGGKFEALHPYGYAHYGNAPQKPAQGP